MIASESTILWRKLISDIAVNEFGRNHKVLQAYVND